MDIVYLCDDNYAMPTIVSMTSLILNKNNDSIYNIHILCDNVKKENIDKMVSLEKKNIQIDIVMVDSKNYDGLEKKYSSVSKSALLKFSIAKYLEKIDRVLYIDGDTIILKDLSNLCNLDLTEFYAAVVKDGPKDNIVGGKKHQYYGENSYFNSGMMLLNLSKIRKEGIVERLINYRLNEYNYFMDQDAFNMVFKNKVMYLGLEYDFMLHLISYINSSFSLKQLINYYNLQQYETIDELFENIAIIHYTFEKPWKYFDIPFNEIWMKYFKASPINQNILKRSSFMTKMYLTKTYTFGRMLSKIVRKILFFKYK